MTPKPSAWTGLLPVDDTALFVSDTGGSGPAVVYLNGAYADYVQAAKLAPQWDQPRHEMTRFTIMRQKPTS